MDGMGFARHAAHPSEPPAGAERADRIARLVRSEIIPRLLTARRAAGGDRAPRAAHVDTLTRLLLARDPAGASAQIAALHEGGMAWDALLDDLVAPAARRLGEWWLADSADFAEVAVGVGRLAQAVRRLGAHLEALPAAAAPQALLATVGPERHALGAQLVAQALRLAGWRVREAPGAEPAALAALVSGARFDLVGLSVGAREAAVATQALTARLRATSRNRRVAVAVGGPALYGDPQAAERLGADFVAADARGAVALARAHLANAQPAPAALPRCAEPARNA